MVNLCTLFNANYLTRGLVLHESLLEHAKNFTLFIFTFDNKSFQILKRLHLKNCVIIPLNELEDKTLLEVKPSRSEVEYCWTCTPLTIRYCLDRFKLDHCTYVDADLIFYQDPALLLKELGNKSVLITEHRYTPKYQYLQEKTGIYCVQFMTFRNTIEGREVLNWWCDACLEWCYNRFEDNKFGDQKYLDDWPTRFSSVHVLEHLGGGVAPWNVQQYSISKAGKTLIAETKTKRKENFKVLFYHFHGVKFYKNGIVNLESFDLSNLVVNNIYSEYIKKLMRMKAKIALFDNSFDPNGAFISNTLPEKNNYKWILILKGIKKTFSKYMSGGTIPESLKEVKHAWNNYHVYTIESLISK